MRESHDYLIIGGGSGGAVMAGRLSEDANTSVCVLEAGGGGNSMLVNTPAATVAMLPTKLNNWGFETVPQPGFNGRCGYQPRGKTLGGSSAINAMVYIRGHRSDYDHWVELGNAGWSYDDVLPYFKLSEGNERFNDQYHGQNGPLAVSDLRSDNPLQQAYVDAGRQAGFPVIDDFNGAEQEGIGVYQVTQKNGERWSVARGYLLPHMDSRPNLTVHTKTRTLRILFDGKRAVGVEVSQGGKTRTIHANKEVIVAAGAFQSPQLLMLSGVGPADELAKHDIPLVHELPGVGQNLQDHPDFIFAYKSKSMDTLGVSLGGTVKLMKDIQRYRKDRRGAITSNFAEGGGFLKTREDLDAPNIQLHFVVALVEDHARKFHLSHGLSCHFCLLRPRSSGSVTLASADPQAAPLIDPGFFSHPDDVEDMVAGFKLTRKIMQQPALAPYITEDVFTADITSDDQIRQILRDRCDTVYHPIGTCKMGVDDMAVVDPGSLKVYGVEGLRVVDASVIPTLIGGNTNAPTVMIAEKAVDMIRGVSRVASDRAQGAA